MSEVHLLCYELSGSRIIRRTATDYRLLESGVPVWNHWLECLRYVTSGESLPVETTDAVSFFPFSRINMEMHFTTLKEPRGFIRILQAVRNNEQGGFTGF